MAEMWFGSSKPDVEDKERKKESISGAGDIKMDNFHQIDQIRPFPNAFP